MKLFRRVISCFVMVTMIVCMLGTAASAQTEAVPQQGCTYVLVHGLFGWGSGEGLNNLMPYWGATSGSIADKLREKGYSCVEASVGPFSSAWDRACELYAQLTGTRVDYGKAHSEKHGHLRYGRTYTEPMIENWGGRDADGKTVKVNLVGHSFGGTTVRMLASLMAYGSAEELAVTQQDDISPLFTGGKAQYINSVTAICSPNNGSTLFYDFERLGLKKFIMYLSYSYAAVLGRSRFNGFVDFHLEQFGLTYIPGETSDSDVLLAFKKLVDRNTDSAYAELSPEGAAQNNAMIKLSPEIYYFSYAYQTTKESSLTGYQVPIPSTFLLLRVFARMMGDYNTPHTEPYIIDETWQPNDGLVNVVSAHHPFGESWKDYSADDVVPGIWNVMPLRTGDHGAPVGVFTRGKKVMSLYDELTQIIEGPEIIQN